MVYTSQTASYDESSTSVNNGEKRNGNESISVSKSFNQLRQPLKSKFVASCFCSSNLSK
jgi:hypothetical protein